MIRTLLITIALGALVCIIAVGAVGAMGGLHIHIGDDDAGPLVASGPTVTRDLPWTGGGDLRVETPSSIVYTQGPQTRMTVTGPKAWVDALQIEDGVLTSRRDRHFHIGHDNKLQVVVTSPATHGFHLSGAQELDLKQYDQDSLELHIAGAASVHGKGHARTLSAHLSGAGEMDLGKLTVDDAVVRIAGAGDATIDPKVSADVAIAGAGHIGLKTRPPQFRQSIAGFGSIDAPQAPAKDD